jgi:hypothetical protein
LTRKIHKNKNALEGIEVAEKVLMISTGFSKAID